MDGDQWKNLADIAVINIYSYLNDHDRKQMSMVCTKWSRLFHTSCLWRCRHFNLASYHAQQVAFKFAQNHGRDLRYVSITCGRPTFQTCPHVRLAAQKIFKAIRNSCIFHFFLPRLEIQHLWKHQGSRQKLITAISNFLKSQRHMTIFDMLSAQMTANGGCRTIEALCSSCGSSLQVMNILDFFHPRLLVQQFERYENAMSRLINLTSLSLNYNCLSDTIVELFAQNLKGKLKSLKIKVNRYDPHFHRISSMAWRFLKRACPLLRVSIYIECIGLSTEIIPILNHEIPLKELNWWSGFDEDLDWRISDTLRHIADQFENSLELFEMEFDNAVERIDDAILYLMKRVKCLRRLGITASIMTSSLEEICQSQLGGRLHLLKCHVTLCGMSENDITDLHLLNEKYQPMLIERDLDFRFTRDFIVDFL